MRQLLRRLLDQDSGEGVAEYALLLAVIGICLMGIIQVMRDAVGDSLSTASTDVSGGGTGGYGSPRTGIQVVPGASYGGGGGGTGGGGVYVPPTGSGGDDPESPDSLGIDSLGVNTAQR
jgi:Flp pilus assembly pilin Flp